jgi:hypothetical protein
MFNEKSQRRTIQKQSLESLESNQSTQSFVASSVGSYVNKLILN